MIVFVLIHKNVLHMYKPVCLWMPTHPSPEPHPGPGRIAAENDPHHAPVHGPRYVRAGLASRLVGPYIKREVYKECFYNLRIIYIIHNKYYYLLFTYIIQYTCQPRTVVELLKDVYDHFCHGDCVFNGVLAVAPFLSETLNG